MICVAYIDAVKGSTTLFAAMWSTPLVVINYVYVAHCEMNGVKGIMRKQTALDWNKMLDDYPHEYLAELRKKSGQANISYNH